MIEDNRTLSHPIDLKTSEDNPINSKSIVQLREHIRRSFPDLEEKRSIKPGDIVTLDENKIKQHHVLNGIKMVVQEVYKGGIVSTAWADQIGISYSAKFHESLLGLSNELC